MKTKIFEALKNKYSNLGFSKEVLEGVAAQLSTFVTEENKIATAVEGAETMLKSFQSFADSRVNAFKAEGDKHKTEAEELKARLAEIEKKPNPEPKPNDVPDYVKSLQETMTQMQKTINGFQVARTSQTLKESFISKMKEKEVPEHFYNATLLGREFDKPESVEELAEAVSKSYDEFKQKSTDLGFSYTKPPEGGGSPEEETEALAKQIRKGTEEIVKNNSETKN